MQEGSQASRHGKLAAKSTRFENSLNDLFDISHSQCKEFTSCQCVKEKKVPRAEQEFLRDQRSSRKMYIDEVDKKAEKMKKRKAAREDRLETRRQEEKQR